MRPVTLTTSDASGAAVASSICPLDLYLTPFQVTLMTDVTGTVDYDLQYTQDDVYASGYNPASGNWKTITGVDGATADAEATLISPVTAVRILQNSGNGSVSCRVIQAGALG